MRISDWSSDVCSSDLVGILDRRAIDLARGTGVGGARLFEIEPCAARADRRAYAGQVIDRCLEVAERGCRRCTHVAAVFERVGERADDREHIGGAARAVDAAEHALGAVGRLDIRSEEHTSELQSLMSLSYAV